MKKNNSIIQKAINITTTLLLTTLVTACSLPAKQTALPTPSFPTVQPTNQPVILTPTAIIPPPAATSSGLSTSAPTLSVPASAVPPATVQPTAVPPIVVSTQPANIPNAIRLSFEAGATEGIFEGQIQPGQVMNFLVGASQNQPLLVATDSFNHDVTFAVIGITDGMVLLDSTQKLSSWQTMLNVTQDYLIQVIGGASTENFNLNVTTPARINFDPGAISAVRQGSTPGGFTVSYVLRANANQQMDIKLTAPNGNAVLSIYGYQDGQPYMRSVVESTVFNMKLPATQDYIIQVVPMAGQVAPYQMEITVQ